MMYAFSRDGAVPGPPALAAAERRARAVHGRDRDRRARVPLRVPGVLSGRSASVALRRGHVDRDDRPLHRVRDPDLPAAARWATRGSRANGTSAATTSRSGSIAVPLGRVHLDPLHPADHARRASRGTADFTWLLVQLRADRGRRHAAARRRLVAALREQVVQGPDRAGHRGGARADRGAVRASGATPARRPPRRRIGSDTGSEGAGAAGSLHEGGLLRADARRAARRTRRSTR